MGHFWIELPLGGFEMLGYVQNPRVNYRSAFQIRYPFCQVLQLVL